MRSTSIASEVLTEPFDPSSFRERHGDGATLLFAMRKGRLRVSTVQAPAPLAGQVQPGDRLYWLGPPEPGPTGAAAAGATDEARSQ